MEQSKEYYAFISYKREDEKWAKWIQDKLEHYRFPTNLNGRTGLPKHIRPTFRDVTDLNPGLLAEEINNALCNSEWLIVVCSPRSAKSPWVCKEAQTFIDLGRADHIIPFVIEGNPFSNDTATECYPEALLNLTGSKELLAANINEMGRDAAVIKVVARMFGLRFDALWRRYEREQRRKIWFVIGGAMLFALVSLGIGGYIAKQNHELDLKNKEVEEERDRANTERDRANSERDKAEAANASLLVANDSIKRQYELIEQQNNEIASERDNVLNANRKMIENKERYLSNIASKLIDNGDINTALTVLLEIEKRQKIIVPEVEEQMRRGVYLFYKGRGQSVLSLSTLSLIHNVYYSPNGNYILSANNDGMIHVWDNRTKMETPSISLGEQYDCIDLAISNNSRFVASGGHIKNHLLIFDLNERTLYKEIRNEYTKSINAYSFSPDNSQVAIGGCQPLCLIDINTGRFRGALIKQNTYINSIEFNDEGSLIITGMGDGTTKIWDASSLKCLFSMDCGSCVYSAKFVTNSIVISGGDNIYLWDINTKSKTAITPKEVNLSSDIMEIVLHPNKEDYAFCQRNGDVFICNIQDRKVMNKLNMKDGACFGLDFSKDGDYLLAGYYNNKIRVWDVSNKSSYIPQLKYDIPEHLEFIHNDSICLLSDWKTNNNYDFHDFKYQFRVWDNIEKKVLFHIPYDTISCHKFYVNPSETLVAIDINNNTGILDLKKNKIISRISGRPLSFSPDGNKVLISKNNKVYLVSINDIENPILITEHDSYISSAYFNSNGNKIITASWDKTIKIIDVNTKKEIHTIRGHQNFCIARYSPHDKYIITGSQDETVRVHDARTFKEIKCFYGHTHSVHSANFSPDGRYLVTTSAHQTIIWDLLTMCKAETINEAVTSGDSYANFTKDGKHIYFCGEKGIQMYEFKSYKRIVNDIKNIISDRALTSEEKKKFYLE